MQLKLSLTIGLLADCVAAISNCGTSGPSEALRSVASQLQKRDDKPGARSHICVDTYVHVIAASEKVEEGYISVRNWRRERAMRLTDLLIHPLPGKNCSRSDQPAKSAFCTS